MVQESARNMGGPQADPARGRRSAVVRLVISALGPVLLIFAAYEVVEGVWLQGVDMERIHLLHWIRGLLAAVVAALVASWLVLRPSPALFPARDWGAAVSERPVAAGGRVEYYAEWFILMRWIAIVVAAMLTFLAIGVAEVLPRDSWRPLMLTIAVLAAMNAAYLALLRAGRTALRVLLPVQAYGDLLILVVLLHFSGGVENPLATLMLFHVIIAGIVLTRRHCYLVAAAGSALFALLVWAEWGHWIEHYTLRVFPHFANGVLLSHAAHNVNYALTGVTVQAAILFLTAYFTTTVTERLRHHEGQLEVFADRLLAQSQLLERALDITGTGLCVCERNFEASWSNRRWEGWFGQRPDRVCVVVTAADGSIPAHDTLRDGSVRVTEVAGVETGDGGTGAEGQRIFQLTTAPLIDQAGATTHVVQLGREITREKQIQAGMVRAEKLAAVGELAGKVAHEVNNPIAIISAKARLLLADHRDDLTPKVAGELTKITDLADRVARIAQGLLSYCRPASGSAAPLDLRVPLRRALDIIEPAAAAIAVNIEEHLSATLPEVRVSGAELEQVFLNLFMNALDVMPGGGRLTVSANLDEGTGGGEAEPGVLVLVEDTGRGIAADIRDRVFEPFVTTKDEGQGTGLGLSICLGLVRSNGGEISLDSEPGLGTRVRIRFPVHDPVTPVHRHG